MSEKITFGELIESIAEETNHSKQFTHDFLKDFVDVINGGLEDDGNVNIAGFGKFKLRRVDEREGYNPQTEEKITIPAHNKVVFKPYKDLRELVNAPYAHLESELIEEEPTADVDKESEDTDASDQDDFIPTGPPTSHRQTEDETEPEEEVPFDLGEDYDEVFTPSGSEQASEGEKESEEEIEAESPFDLEEDSHETDESAPPLSKQEQDEEESDDGDIVEFNADAETQKEEKKESFNVDDFISSIEPSETKDAETSGEEADPFPDENEDIKEEEELSTEDVAGEQDESKSLAQDFENAEEDDEISDAGLDDFIGSSDESTEDEEVVESSEEETEQELVEKESADDMEDEGDHTNPFAPDFEDQKEEKEEENQLSHTTSFASKRHSRNQSSKMPIFIAAAVVLLLVAAGAWYFTGSSNNSSPQIATSETTSTSDVADKKSDQRKASADNQADTKTQSQQPAKPNQSQPQQTSSAGSGKATAQQTPNNESLEIKKGQTLWSLAEEKYGNPRLWPWIYGNNGSLENPDHILAGNSLSVPLPSGPQNTLNSADSVGVAKGFLSTYRWYKANQAPIAKNHLWAAKSYHDNIRDIADIKIDKADLTYANQAR